MFSLKWVEGRAGTGYFKFKLLESKRFKFDAYLLKYGKGAWIPTHTDPAIAGYRHYRLNICLKRAYGGNFYAWHKEVWHWPFQRIVLFRPDVVPHLVEEVIKGTRYVLSIGWLIKERE